MRREHTRVISRTHTHTHTHIHTHTHTHTHIYIYIYIELCIYLWPIVFAKGSGDKALIPGRVIAKTQKWHLIRPYLILSIIRYVSKVKWNNPEKGEHPAVHFGVVAIEKGAFESPPTTISNITKFIYMYICIYDSDCVFSKNFRENKSYIVSIS